MPIQTGDNTMQNIYLSSSKTATKKAKKHFFKHNIWRWINTAGPLVVLALLILGSAFELIYWKNILWLLVY